MLIYVKCLLKRFIFYVTKRKIDNSSEVGLFRQITYNYSYSEKNTYVILRELHKFEMALEAER